MSEAAPEGLSRERPGPARRFGVFTATFVVISSMVGSGVLTTSGFTVYNVHSNGLMLGLWVVGGVVAICGALTIAELASAMPRSGGDYVFLLEAYGPLVAFLSGWVSFLIGFGGPIAVTASAASRYVTEPFQMEPAAEAITRQVLATAAIIVLAILHSSGAGASIRTQGVTTVVKLCVLTALAAAGLVAGWGRWSNLKDIPPVDLDLGVAMLFALVYISYAYTGWNGAGYIAGELARPRRQVPAAILLGTGLVVLLYLALNTFYALALSYEDVRSLVEDGRERPEPSVVAPIASLAAERFFGNIVSRPLSLAVGATLLASLSAYILTGPRVVQAMAAAGQFPAIAAPVSRRTGAPVVATWLQVTWSLILLWSGSFESLLEYSSVGLALISMLTISTIFVLRWKRPELERPFRVPWYPVVPAVYLALTGLLTVAAFARKPVESSLALASILIGVPFYLLWRRRSAGEAARPGPNTATE
jgi:APA family basic amino acid/polyamine antiporter